MRRHLPLLAFSASCLSFRAADNGGPSGGAAPAGDEKPGEKKETPPAPAPSPAPAPAPTPSPAPAATTETAVVKPSIFTKAAAMLKDKSELLTTISERDATIVELSGKLSKAMGTIQAQMTELSELQAGKAEIEAALEASTKKNTTVEAAAADKIAALGFPADKLPPVTSAEAQDGDAPKTMEEFQKTHGELVGANKTEAASKFYDKFAQKFGL